MMEIIMSDEYKTGKRTDIVRGNSSGNPEIHSFIHSFIHTPKMSSNDVFKHYCMRDFDVFKKFSILDCSEENKY